MRRLLSPAALRRRPDRLLAPCCCLALALTVPGLRGQSASVSGAQPLNLVSSPALSARTTAAALAAFRATQQGQQDGSGPFRITPERRALLNTIRYAEGTWVGGSNDGYRMLYGGGRFSDLARHPEITVSRRYSSAAAGAYQFLPGTWREAARRLGLQDFRPASQDQAALYLVQKRGALERFDRQGLSHDVLARLAPEWASLPTLQGFSRYGQPVKDAFELRRFYTAELSRQRALVAI